MTIHLKNPDEIAAMREAGRIVARAHAEMKAALRPGISTAELDKIAETVIRDHGATVIRDHGATPAFLGVQKQKAPDFPATITASINHELIHGIPRKDRILKEGDVIGLDTGCHYQGFVGDSAWTYVVGKPSPMVARFLKVAEEALWVGIGASVLPHTGTAAYDPRCGPGNSTACRKTRVQRCPGIHRAWCRSGHARRAGSPQLVAEAPTARPTLGEPTPASGHDLRIGADGHCRTG